MPSQETKTEKGSDVPPILILSSIRPEEIDGELHSPRLQSRIEEYRKHETDLWNELEDSEELDEASMATRLAKLYFLETALQLQQCDESTKVLWTERFNDAIEQLYGAPESVETVRIAQHELPLLQGAEDSSVFRVYEEVASESGQEQSGNSGTLAEREIQEVKTLFEKRFDYLFSILNEFNHEGSYEMSEVKSIFKRLLEALREHDSRTWEEWKIIDGGGASLSVVATDKVIKVPEKRGSIKDHQTLISRVTHELLVHAYRANNAYRENDEELATGLPDYLIAEEGFGIFMERAMTGEVPVRARDRYFDIALATGVVGENPMPRDTLYEFVVDRALTRAKLAESTVTEQTLLSIKKKAKTHVNRIFRGGTGVQYVSGDEELIQPVFTKDIVYHSGNILIQRFIRERLDSGKAMEEIIEHLLIGKFDPTNPEHQAYIAQYTDF